MKTLSIIFTLALFQIAQSQNHEMARTFYLDGIDAFTNKELPLAKEKFIKAVESDSLYRDAWFNLAAVQLALHDPISACESFYKAHRLHDPEAMNYLKQNCSNFRGGSFKSLDEVDTLPQYVYENQTYPLFENGNLSSHYIKLLTKALKKSNIIRNYQRGKLIVSFYITKEGDFIGQVIRDGAAEKSAEVRNETIKIFREIVRYIPATYLNQNVNTWEGWTLPINFNK